MGRNYYKRGMASVTALSRRPTASFIEEYYMHNTDRGAWWLPLMRHTPTHTHKIAYGCARIVALMMGL